MNRQQVADAIRTAQAGTTEEARTALARVKLARARMNSAPPPLPKPMAATLRLFSVSVEGDDRAVQAAARAVRRLFNTPTDRRPRR